MTPPPGRRRKHQPGIPAHIDQASLPRGVYWDRSGAGRWYIFETGDDGRKRTKTIATRDAKLSELQRILEERAGIERGTLRALMSTYHDAPAFTKLAKSTRADYSSCRDRVLEFTGRTGSFADLDPWRIKRPMLQVLIDRIAQGRKRDAEGQLIPTPSTAAHVLRYLRVVFRWGANRGLCAEVNPAEGIEPPIERKQRRLPSHQAFAAVVAYAKASGKGQRGLEGSHAPYLWAAAEIAYLCRLRGIEIVCDLSDANVRDDGLLCERRKGSLPNLTHWDDRLRDAYDALVTQRNMLWEKNKLPIPMRQQDRPLVVSTTGHPLTKSAFNSAWQRMIRAAIAAGVISAEDRFSMHDLKRRGVTDTTGTRGEKQQASGHRSEAMLDIYDLDVPSVDTAATSLKKRPKPPEF